MPKPPQPPVPLKARQRAFREDAILDAARGLFATRGFEAVTIDEVIAAVGISKPTFYAHFPSKEDLGIRVLLRAMAVAQEQLATLEAALPAEQAVRAMLDWSVDRHFGAASERDFSGAGSLFAHEAVRVAERELAKRLAALIAKAQKSGALRSPAPAPFVAQTLHSILKDAAYDDLHRRGRLDLAAFKASLAALLLGD